MGFCCSTLSQEFINDLDYNPNIYEKYGGMVSVNAFVELLFDKLIANKYTKNRFAGANIKKIKKHMKKYFAVEFGA